MKDVIFLGSKGIGHHCLSYLLANQSNLDVRVTAVLTNDRKLKPDDLSIRDLCTSHHIPVLDQTDELLHFDRPDFLLSVQYHEILPQQYIDRARELAINLHMAPLPEYRGCNLFSFAIIDEAKQFGTTLHVLNAGIDAGDILFERRFDIDHNCMVTDLYERTLAESKTLFENNIGKIFLGQYSKIPQSSLHKERGTSIHYRKEMNQIKEFDKSWDNAKILRHYRATYFPPFPPPYFIDGDEKVEVTPEWIQANITT